MDAKWHVQLFYMFLGLTINVILSLIYFITPELHAIQAVTLVAIYHARSMIHPELNQTTSYKRSQNLI